MEQELIPFRLKPKFGQVKYSKTMTNRAFPGTVHRLHIKDRYGPSLVNVVFEYVDIQQKKKATHVALTILGHENPSERQLVVLRDLKTNSKTFLDVPARIFDKKYQYLTVKDVKKENQNKPV
jgi:hypothetical protein